MAGFIGGGSSGPDYLQADEPADPDPLEQWYDTDADPNGDGTQEGAMKILGTDGEWHTITIDDHGELGGVLEDNHHQFPIPTSGLVDGAVTAAKAAFDYVTPAEFTDHTGDTTNPHAVTDDQTGAADALGNHASSANVHHTPPDLDGHAGDADAHHSSPTFASNSGTIPAGGEVTVNWPISWSKVYAWTAYRSSGHSVTLTANGVAYPTKVDDQGVTFKNTNTQSDFDVTVNVIGK